jgi:hypothetical protein
VQAWSTPQHTGKRYTGLRTRTRDGTNLQGFPFRGVALLNCIRSLAGILIRPLLRSVQRLTRRGGLAGRRLPMHASAESQGGGEGNRRRDRKHGVRA